MKDGVEELSLGEKRRKLQEKMDFMGCSYLIVLQYSISSRSVWKLIIIL